MLLENCNTATLQHCNAEDKKIRFKFRELKKLKKLKDDTTGMW